MSEESEKIRLAGEYWKQVVNVQMHFNDLCMRTRWLLLTVNSTIIAAATVIFKEDNLKFNIKIYDSQLNLHVSILLIIFCLGLCAMLRLLDKDYYFRMLLSAVVLENTISDIIFSPEVLEAKYSSKFCGVKILFWLF